MPTRRKWDSPHGGWAGVGPYVLCLLESQKAALPPGTDVMSPCCKAVLERARKQTKQNKQSKPLLMQIHLPQQRGNPRTRLSSAHRSKPKPRANHRTSHCNKCNVPLRRSIAHPPAFEDAGREHCIRGACGDAFGAGKGSRGVPAKPRGYRWGRWPRLGCSGGDACPGRMLSRAYCQSHAARRWPRLITAWWLHFARCLLHFPCCLSTLLAGEGRIGAETKCAEVSMGR